MNPSWSGRRAHIAQTGRVPSGESWISWMAMLRFAGNTATYRATRPHAASRLVRATTSPAPSAISSAPLSQTSKRGLVQWILLGVLVGLFCGSASALFLHLLDRATSFRGAHRSMVFALPLAGLALGALYERFGKAIKGGNNLVIDTIHDDGPEIPLRMAPMVLVGTVLTHLFGGSAGREGTAVQMGASLADAIAHRIGVSSAVRRQLLAAGVAGGFGSVFGTPIAGTVFGLEFVSLGRIEYDALIPALVAALVGDVTTRAWGVGHTPTPRRRASRSPPCWR
jgi:H+/Cl- antiporter ClcA